MSYRLAYGYRILIIAVLSMVMVACSDLAGEPEIVATVPSTSNTVADVELPPSAPDIANGARIYQQSCTSCHGEIGAGDGELVESGDVPRMGSFLDPVHMRQQSPAFYYDIITNGNIINLMPPWSGSLSVQERWDVAMYAYTLQYTQEQVARGEELTEGVSTDIALQSDNALVASSEFEGEDAYAVLAYQRVQSVSNWGATVDETASTIDEPEIALEAVTFSGQVVQGSPNASLPSDMRLQLQYGDFVEAPTILDGVIGDNGQFSFEDVPALADSTYFAVVFTDGRVFVSEQLTSEDLQAETNLDVTVYETSNAPNIVNQTQLNLILDYLTVPELGSGLVVNHTALYDNPTNYVFHLEPEGQNVRVSLLVTLPVGAIFLDAPEQSPFIQVPDQYSLIDTRPIYPGTHLIETSYFVSYENTAKTIDLVMNNRFVGEVSITLIDPELRITGSGFVFSEELNLGTEEQPIPATVYTADVDLQAGENLIFDIEGRVSLNTSDDNNLITQDQLLPILIGVIVAVIVIGGGVVVYLRRGGGKQDEIDHLVAEINRLEKLHEAGQINHDVFQDKRSKLKEQLATLMAESQAE